MDEACSGEHHIAARARVCASPTAYGELMIGLGLIAGILTRTASEPEVRWPLMPRMRRWLQQRLGDQCNQIHFRFSNDSRRQCHPRLSFLPKRIHEAGSSHLLPRRIGLLDVALCNAIGGGARLGLSSRPDWLGQAA